MYDPKDIIDLLADNVAKTRNPFGISKYWLNGWWKKFDIPRQGGSLLFTGLMYQFMPYIEKTTAYLESYEDSKWAGYARYGKLVPKTLTSLGLAAITPLDEKLKFTNILRNISTILTKSGVDFHYDPSLDDYSGILLYDLGAQDEFVRHAKYVAEKLKAKGVKKIITVDPHTTYALKILFPKYTGISFEVKTYFELINLHSKNGCHQVTLHDPCFYGRYLELSDVPVKALGKLGVECVPARNSGLYTSCCGGPAESISPKLSAEIVERRVAELQETGKQIIAMCPICLGNLRKAGADVEDLSSLIMKCME